jgi:hypothetical protein
MKLCESTAAAVFTSILLFGTNVATPLEPLPGESVFGSLMNLGSAL